MIGDGRPGIQELSSLVFGLWPLIGLAVFIFLVVGMIRARRKANWKFFTRTRARWKAERNSTRSVRGHPPSGPLPSDPLLDP